MTPVSHTLRVEEQERANRLVRQLAALLGAPIGVEICRNLSDDLMVYALYRGWRLDAYVELEEGERDQPPGVWVLILSRGDARAYRAFTGAARNAAEHVHRFAADEGYRRRWLREGGDSPSRPPNRRILVVEDRGDTAETLRVLLQLVGYEVRVAATGPDGLQQATAWLPDAVLCDIGLPGLDGYAVAEQLRANPATAGIRLVAITGYGSEADRAQARQAGFDHHFTKPADPVAVLQVLPRPAPGRGIGRGEPLRGSGPGSGPSDGPDSAPVSHGPRTRTPPLRTATRLREFLWADPSL